MTTNHPDNNSPTNSSSKEVEPALEPCPFCGGPAEKRLTDGPKRGFIGCFTCMIGLPFNKSYRQHIVERLKTPEDAGGYLAASLKDNADYPDATCLVIQDIVAAFSLPLEVNTLASADSAGAMVDELRRELSFCFGAYHATTNHQLPAVQCMEDGCVRIKKLLYAASVPDQPANVQTQVARTAAEAIINEFESVLLVPDGYTHKGFYGQRFTDIIAKHLRTTAASPAPKEEEARPRKIFDAGFSAKPSGATREAAEAIVKAWLWHTPEYDQERARQDIEQIISRHFPTAVESRCVHNVPVGYGCHYCPDTIATTPPAPLVSDCDPDD